MTEPGPPPSALFTAIADGDPTSVAAALAAGADPQERDTDDWSPLDRAAGRGDPALVALLLEYGADPAAVGGEDRTPYRIALAAGHLDAARILRNALEQADPASAAGHRWQPYCRAYSLDQLRAAPQWRDDRVAELGDDEIVFLHDDHTVTREIWPGEDVVFDEVTEQWRTFCAEQLGFAVPDDFDLVPDAQNRGVI